MKRWEESEYYRKKYYQEAEHKDNGELTAGQSSKEGQTVPVWVQQSREARMRCLHLLQYSPRTVYQLERRLVGEGFCEEAVRDAIAYAGRFGYVNDEGYARNYVRSRGTKKSRRQLLAEMLQRGVPKDAALAALEEYQGEEEAVRRLVQKNLAQMSCPDEKALERLIGKLSGKGFRYELVKRTVWAYWEKEGQEL